MVEKKIAIWLKTLSGPSVTRSAATGTSHRARQTADDAKRARDGRAGMLGQFLAEQGVRIRDLLAALGRTMPAADLEGRQARRVRR